MSAEVTSGPAPCWRCGGNGYVSACAWAIAGLDPCPVCNLGPPPRDLAERGVDQGGESDRVGHSSNVRAATRGGE